MLISIEFSWSVACPTFFQLLYTFCFFFFHFTNFYFCVLGSVKLKRKTIIINPSTFDERNWICHDLKSYL